MNEKALERSLEYMKDWLRFRYEREDIPGFVVAVAHKGEVLFNEAYGYAELEKKEKLTSAHIFRIASHSKTFTATAVMQLQEQDKLRIDDPVVKYLPWLNKHNDKRWQNVTIRQLLSHGAGVIRDGLEQGYWSLERPFPDEERFKQDILETELVLDNNIKMKYSNYGYTLLGLVIEAVSGQPYNQYVTDNIIKPLGLKNTGPEFTKQIEKDLVTGYSRVENDKKRLPIVQIDTRAMSPATGFYSTSEDLCNYFTAHIVGSGKLLSDESKKEMQRVHWKVEGTKKKEEYGLGLEIEYENRRKLFGHSGGFPGFVTQSFCDPKNELVVIVLTNGLRSWAGYIAHCIIKNLDYFQDNWKTSTKLGKYEGRFMAFWSLIDVVAIGNKLICANPSIWEPFKNPEELEHKEGNSFKVSKAPSFSSPGELVHFNFKNDKVDSVIYAGEEIFPEKEYLKNLSGKKRVG